MPDDAKTTPDEIQIDLRQPGVAALWAWLWPGAGHIYQRRYGKGILYMACILGTWFFGLGMANGHCVYMKFERGPEKFRWHYLLQMGIGLPAMPAIVQAARVNSGKLPWGGPNGWMAPPGEVSSGQFDRLALWHAETTRFFDIGTVYTVVAGLLNLLVIYDAYAGPVIAQPEEEKDKEKEKDKQEKSG
jgi:hypothetical protein